MCGFSVHQHINIEIKAICSNQDRIRDILKIRHAKFLGKDHQFDTYYRVQHGRLKLREGHIENALIYYERENATGTKKSEVILYKIKQESQLKEILTAALGVLIVVDKQREIYFVDGNVKIHIDMVRDLGNFIEIEAIDTNGSIGEQRLLEQCREYIGLFGITEHELVDGSYSDLLLKNKTNKNGLVI